MSDALATATTTTLLEGLRDSSRQELWREFDARFRPIVFGVARRAGLSEDDAEEATQQTMAEFVRDFRAGKYERSKGRLRSWILGIARHRITDAMRERQRRRARRGESAFESLVEAPQFDQFWQVEQDQRLADLAWNELRASTRTTDATLTAFQMFALERVPAEQVAQRCGITTPEVYRIKHRLTKRLHDIVTRLRGAFEADL